MSYARQQHYRDEFEDRAPQERRITRPRGRQPTFAERQLETRRGEPAANSNWDLIPENTSDCYRPDFG